MDCSSTKKCLVRILPFSLWNRRNFGSRHDMSFLPADFLHCQGWPTNGHWMFYIFRRILFLLISDGSRNSLLYASGYFSAGNKATAHILSLWRNRSFYSGFRNDNALPQLFFACKHFHFPKTMIVKLSLLTGDLFCHPERNVPYLLKFMGKGKPGFPFFLPILILIGEKLPLERPQNTNWLL